MTTVNFYGLPFKITKRPITHNACNPCWFKGSGKPCPNPDGEPVIHDASEELYCVTQDDDVNEAFFVLDTPDGHADYIAKKLEGA